MRAANETAPAIAEAAPMNDAHDTGDADALTTAEVKQLAADEAIIESNQVMFLKVGMALSRIRDQRLYRATHDTFAEYVDQRWGFTRTRAYQLIESGLVAEQMSTMVDIPIENERQARAIASVVKESGPEAAAEILRDVEESDGKLTAKAITAKVKVKPKPKAKPEPKPKAKPKPEPEPTVTVADIKAMPLSEVAELDITGKSPKTLQNAYADRMLPVWCTNEAVENLALLTTDEWQEVLDNGLAPDLDDMTAAAQRLAEMMDAIREHVGGAS